MRFTYILYILLLPTLNYAQDKPQPKINTYLLEVGENLNFGNKSISFKEVISDSRCPTGVTCIWPGEAIISIEVYEDGKIIDEKEISVASTGIPLEFSRENIIYNIAGFTLNPYPSVKTHNSKKEYTLHLRLSETVRN